MIWWRVNNPTVARLQVKSTAELESLAVPKGKWFLVDSMQWQSHAWIYKDYLLTNYFYVELQYYSACMQIAWNKWS